MFHGSQLSRGILVHSSRAGIKPLRIILDPLRSDAIGQEGSPRINQEE